MKIQAYVKQATGAEAPLAGLVHLIAAGRGAGSNGTLALLNHLVSGREQHLRGGGSEG